MNVNDTFDMIYSIRYRTEPTSNNIIIVVCFHGTGMDIFAQNFAQEPKDVGDMNKIYLYVYNRCRMLSSG
jgi:hypothetical protein